MEKEEDGVNMKIVTKCENFTSKVQELRVIFDINVVALGPGATNDPSPCPVYLFSRDNSGLHINESITSYSTDGSLAAGANQRHLKTMTKYHN